MTLKEAAFSRLFEMNLAKATKIKIVIRENTEKIVRRSRPPPSSAVRAGLVKGRKAARVEEPQ